jgi:hypothetical protein
MSRASSDVVRWRKGQAAAAARQRELLRTEGPNPEQAVAESLAALNALDALESREPPVPPEAPNPYAALRALSGTAHSDFTDISTDKYAHKAYSLCDALRFGHASS